MNRQDTETQEQALPAITHENTAPAPAAPAAGADMTAGEMFQSMLAMAKDPQVDAGKMQALADLQLKMMDHSRSEEFNRAKFAAMQDMPSITKNKAICGKDGKVRSRYSDFKQLYSTVKPVLSRHGLILDFDVDEMGGDTKVPMLKVAPILRHQNGYIEHGSYMPVPITTPNSTVTLTQGAKGAVETGKRTVLIACLGITEEETEDVTGDATKAPGGDWDRLVDDGQVYASRGSQPYQEWYKGLTNMQRGWLVDNGHHANFKNAAEFADNPS